MDTDTIAVLKLNRSSQTTIPKAVRELLGVSLGDRLRVERGRKKGEVIVSRELSLYEKFQEFNKTLSPETKARIKAISERFKDNPQDLYDYESHWYETESARKIFQEKYQGGLAE